MKLTKDMFDFEKYEYFTKWAPNSNYLCGIEPMRWQPPKDNLPDGLYRREKPPPRYILLNDGENLRAGDQQYSPLVKSWTPGIGNYLHQKVEAGEIWRRKVQE